MSKNSEKWTRGLRAVAFKRFTTGKYDEEIKFNVHFYSIPKVSARRKNRPRVLHYTLYYVCGIIVFLLFIIWNLDSERIGFTIMRFSSVCERLSYQKYCSHYRNQRRFMVANYVYLVHCGSFYLFFTVFII